jgi:hypothetical protein
MPLQNQYMTDGANQVGLVPPGKPEGLDVLRTLEKMPFSKHR